MKEIRGKLIQGTRKRITRKRPIKAGQKGKQLSLPQMIQKQKDW